MNDQRVLPARPILILMIVVAIVVGVTASYVVHPLLTDSTAVPRYALVVEATTLQSSTTPTTAVAVTGTPGASGDLVQPGTVLLLADNPGSDPHFLQTASGQLIDASKVHLFASQSDAINAAVDLRVQELSPSAAPPSTPTAGLPSQFLSPLPSVGGSLTTTPFPSQAITALGAVTTGPIGTPTVVGTPSSVDAALNQSLNLLQSQPVTAPLAAVI